MIPRKSQSKLPAKLAACSAALLAGASASAGDLEGVVRATDGVVPTSAATYGECPTCPPAGVQYGRPGVVVPGLPVPAVGGAALGAAGAAAGVVGGAAGHVGGHVGGHLAKFAPDGYITWGEIGTALRNKPALIPPLGGYDAYLPPDYGWQAPQAYPVQRVPVGYQRYYPSQWYGLPGSQKAAVAPVAFMPTDTSQLGYYHQQVPTWQPLPPGSLPAPPDPRVLHSRVCPAGPDVGVYPGAYPNEPRGGLIGLRDRLHDRHGATGGTIVTDPVVGGAPAPGCPTPGVSVDPLPSSTGIGEPVENFPPAGDAPDGDPLPAPPAL